MKAGFFSSFFKSVVPPPRMLLMQGAGLEVSEHSVKYFSLEHSKRGYGVGVYGSETVEQGVIAEGEIKNPDALNRVLGVVRAKIRTPLVAVSLPEQKGYLFQTHLEKVPDLHVREALEFTLEEHVPLTPGEAVFDFDLLSQDANAVYLNVTAFPRKTVEGYYAALTRSGFLPLSFEMESQAAVRTVIPNGDTKTRLVIDFGETRTAISIIDSGFVRFTTSLEIAGASLMNALQKSLGVDRAEAERLKNEEGLLAGASGKKVAEVLMPTISALKDEVNRRFIYWHTHQEQNEQEHHTIEEVILCGGNANLRGLPEYLEQALRVSVRIPNVWTNVLGPTSGIPSISRNESLRYATVIGLALRGRTSL